MNVRITDILGRELHRQAISNSEEINIAAIPNGLYFLTVTNHFGKVFCGKFGKRE